MGSKCCNLFRVWTLSLAAAILWGMADLLYSPSILLVPCFSVLRLVWFVTYFKGCFGLLLGSHLRGSMQLIQISKTFFFPWPFLFVLFWFFFPVWGIEEIWSHWSPHSNILFLEQERGDWRQNPNKPDKARTNHLPPNIADFQSCMPWDRADKRGRTLFIKGRKSAVWMAKIMPKKADERVNRRKKE